MALARPFNLERAPAALPPFGRDLGLDLLCSSYSFKPWLFSMPPGHLGLVGARGPGVAEVAGWLGCLDPAPVCRMKGEYAL